MAIAIPTDWQDRGPQFFSPSTKSTKSKAGSYCDEQCNQVNGDCVSTNYIAGSAVITINSQGSDCSVSSQAVYAVRYRVKASEFTLANLNLLSGALNTDIVGAGNPCTP